MLNVCSLKVTWNNFFQSIETKHGTEIKNPCWQKELTWVKVNCYWHTYIRPGIYQECFELGYRLDDRGYMGYLEDP